MKLKLNIQRFASTNKTANYNLSQYVGSDKPTYLGDYNSDMSKIDTQMKTNSTTISEVNTKAELAKTTADTALQNADLAQTTADEANTTATSALQKAVTNEANINKFNLTNIKNYTNSISVNGTVDYTNITVAMNSDSSIAKIYGSITYSNPTPNQRVESYIMTDLRPTEEITIDFSGNCQRYSDSHFGRCTMIIGTDGKLTFKGTQTDQANDILVSWFLPCIYFLQNFGDVDSII